MTVANQSSRPVQIRPMLRRTVERIMAIDAENKAIATQDSARLEHALTRQAHNTCAAFLADMVEVCEQAWQAKGVLSASQNRRLTKLSDLLTQQLNGHTVSLRALRGALTSIQFAYF